MTAQTINGSEIYDPSNEEHEIVYAAAHPRAANAAFDSIVLAPEEIRSVSRQQAIFRPDIWKTLLWGSIRDLDLIDRLRLRFPSVKQIISERKWTSGQGFQVAGGGASSAAHMYGLPVIPTSAVTPLRIASRDFQPFLLPTLHRPRDIALYRGPHVIVRRTMYAGRLAAAFVDEDAVFPNGSLGFAGPESDRHLLMTLTGAIVSSLGNYFHFMTNASWGVERDFVELNEHLTLPLATPDRRQSEALEEIFSAWTNGSDPELRRALDQIIFEIYEVSETDRQRVQDGLRSGLERFRNPQVGAGFISRAGLTRYADTIHQCLETTLADLIIESRSFVDGTYRCVTITLIPDAISEPVDSDGNMSVDIQRIMEMSTKRDVMSTGIVAQPAGFYVDGNTFYIVKTADADRWSVDVAVDDAGRIVSALAFGV